MYAMYCVVLELELDGARWWRTHDIENWTTGVVGFEGCHPNRWGIWMESEGWVAILGCGVREGAMIRVTCRFRSGRSTAQSHPPSGSGESSSMMLGYVIREGTDGSHAQ